MEALTNGFIKLYRIRLDIFQINTQCMIKKHQHFVLNTLVCSASALKLIKLMNWFPAKLLHKRDGISRKKTEQIPSV